MFGGIGCDCRILDGSPRGERTYFKADLLKDRCIGKTVRIYDFYRLRVVAINIAMNILAEFGSQIGNDRRKKRIPQKYFSAGICFFVERVLFGVAALFPRFVDAVSENAPIKNQIDIFRKPFYRAVCL